MSDRLAVDTDGLIGSAGGLDGLVEKMTGIYEICQAIAGMDGVFGDDASGKQFEAAYRSPAEQITDAVSSSRDALSSISSNIRLMANGFAATEDQNASAVAATPKSVNGAELPDSASRPNVPKS